MASHCRAAQNSIDRQADLFRLAERDHGISLSLLARRTEIPVQTLRTWSKGTVMPAWALFKLGQEGGIPDELLSLLGEPFKRAVSTDDENAEGAIDDAAEAAMDLALTVGRARHPNGPGGTAIVPQERAEIEEKARIAMAAIRQVLA
jgi:hypothetical protein